MDLSSQELARVLRSVGLALLGIYAVTVLAAMLPLALLDPVWIERVCGSLRGGVSFPLIAMVLLLGASLVQQDSGRSGITTLRKVCLWASFGFVLMIPLQTWAGVEVLRQTLYSDRQQFAPYEAALGRIRSAGSAQQLIATLSSLPGAPSLSGSLQQPLPQVRQQLLSQLQPQIEALENQLRQRRSQRWQSGLLRWSKDAAVALFSALGFAAIPAATAGWQLFPWRRNSRRDGFQRSVKGGELIDYNIGAFDPDEDLPLELDPSGHQPRP